MYKQKTSNIFNCFIKIQKAGYEYCCLCLRTNEERQLRLSESLYDVIKYLNGTAMGIKWNASKDLKVCWICECKLSIALQVILGVRFGARCDVLVNEYRTNKQKIRTEYSDLLSSCEREIDDIQANSSPQSNTSDRDVKFLLGNRKRQINGANVEFDEDTLSVPSSPLQDTTSQCEDIIIKTEDDAIINLEDPLAIADPSISQIQQQSVPTKAPPAKILTCKLNKGELIFCPVITYKGKEYVTAMKSILENGVLVPVDADWKKIAKAGSADREMAKLMEHVPEIAQLINKNAPDGTKDKKSYTVSKRFKVMAGKEMTNVISNVRSLATGNTDCQSAKEANNIACNRTGNTSAEAGNTGKASVASVLKPKLMEGDINWEDKIPMEVISFADATDPLSMNFESSNDCEVAEEKTIIVEDDVICLD